jgi:hypothetical protein
MALVSGVDFIELDFGRNIFGQKFLSVNFGQIFWYP